MIEVRLFGDLRRHFPDPTSPSGTVLQLPNGDGETVGQVLARMGIDLQEVSNVFLNGRLVPRSAYPITLGYPLTARVPVSPERLLETPVHSGDRLGLFPRNMGVVVV